MATNELNVFSNGGNIPTPASTITSMAMTRQAQEVQAAMLVAKRFPRDEAVANDRILQACTRPSLAESAIYSYSRGGTEVSGPSVRLAEAIAQAWGNIDFGFIELEQNKLESQVMAYAWDLETNTRQSKVFSVPHIRQTKSGAYPLTDPRDIYEMVANQAARRVRSCILAIIPGDVVDSAVKQCELTLKTGNNVPLEARINDMVQKFAEYEVTEKMLAAYVGKNVSAFTEKDVISMAKVYRALKDGIAGIDVILEKIKNSAPAEEDVEEMKETPPRQRNTKKAQQKIEEEIEEELTLDDL